MHKISFTGILHTVETVIDKFGDFFETVMDSPIGDLLSKYTALIPDRLENLTLFQIMFGAGFTTILVLLLVNFLRD